MLLIYIEIKLLMKINFVNVLLVKGIILVQIVPTYKKRSGTILIKIHLTDVW